MTTKKRTLKRASTSAGKRARENARQLAQIETLLGEEFESLAQAKHALKAETEPAPSKKRNESKRSYTIRELKPDEKQTINAFLNDTLTADKLDATLLKQGELWGLETEHQFTGLDAKQHKGTARSYQTYGQLEKAFKKITEYVTHGKFTSTRGRNSFINSIKVIRFGNSVKRGQDAGAVKHANRLEWVKLKRDEVAVRLKRKKQLISKIRTGERRGTIIGGLRGKLASYEQQQKEDQRTIRSLENQLKKRG